MTPQEWLVAWRLLGSPEVLPSFEMLVTAPMKVFQFVSALDYKERGEFMGDVWSVRYSLAAEVLYRAGRCVGVQCISSEIPTGTFTARWHSKTAAKGDLKLQRGDMSLKYAWAWLRARYLYGAREGFPEYEFDTDKKVWWRE